MPFTDSLNPYSNNTVDHESDVCNSVVGKPEYPKTFASFLPPLPRIFGVECWGEGGATSGQHAFFTSLGFLWIILFCSTASHAQQPTPPHNPSMQNTPTPVYAAPYSLSPPPSPNVQPVVQSNGQRIFQVPTTSSVTTTSSNPVQQASWSESSKSSDHTKSRAPLEIKSSPKSKQSVDKPSSQWSAILSMIFSLTIVTCLFLFVVWLYRKSQPNSFVKLPKDVVQIMGRSAMAPRQQVYVVRFGNKMLLVSHQPGQTQTLGEITDPLEVERLAGLCEASQPTSITHSFRDVMSHVVSGKSDDERPRTERRSRMSRT